MKPVVVKMSKKYWPSRSVAPSETTTLTSKSVLPQGSWLAAGQAQVHAIVQIFAAAIATAVHVAHHEIALVDILSCEEEAMVVGPHAALKFAPIARHFDEAIPIIRARGARIRRILVDGIAAGERRAPAVIVERAREVMHVSAAIAFRAVVHVVEVKLRLVAAEAAIYLAGVVRQRVVDARQNRLAIAQLDKARRHFAAFFFARGTIAIRPDGVRALRRHARVEIGALVTGGDVQLITLAEVHEIAGLGKILIPALMGEGFTPGPALHRAAQSLWITERVVRRRRVQQQRIATEFDLPLVEIRVIRQPLGSRLVHRRAVCVEKYGLVIVAVGEAGCDAAHPVRGHISHPIERLRERACTEQRRARRARGFGGEGASGERA